MSNPSSSPSSSPSIESLQAELSLLRDELRAQRATRRTKTQWTLAALGVLLAAGVVHASTLTDGLYVFDGGTAAMASEVNANFNQLRTWLRNKVGQDLNSTNVAVAGTLGVSGVTTINPGQVAGESNGVVGALTVANGSSGIVMDGDEIDSFTQLNINTNGTRPAVNLGGNLWVAGNANVAGNATVAGNLSVTGNVAVGFEQKTCSGNGICTCGAGRVLLGGGGNCTSGGSLITSIPSFTTVSVPGFTIPAQSWVVGCTAGTANSYVICARLAP